MRTLGPFPPTAVLLVSVGLALLPAGRAGANLIVNGGFDTPDVAGSFVTLNAAPAGFGWELVSDGTAHGTATTGFLGVDVINTLWTAPGGTANPDGVAQSLDIDRTSSISQAFATLIGVEYSVVFDYSHNRFAASASGGVQVDGATLRLQELLVHDIANSAVDMKWLQFSDHFVADSTTTVLTLFGDIANVHLGFVVDNVVVEAVPEPASAALLGIGLAALGARRRRLA